jgi:hypothetical protein
MHDAAKSAQILLTSVTSQNTDIMRSAAALPLTYALRYATTLRHAVTARRNAPCLRDMPLLLISAYAFCALFAAAAALLIEPR